MTDDVSLAIAEDRRILAKALHDGLCQDLTGGSLLAQVLAANLSSVQHPFAEDAIALRKLLIKASADLHALYAHLEPPK